MEMSWLLHNLIVALGLLEECSAFPLHLGAGGIWSAGVASPLTPIALGAATLLAAVVLLLGCVCCRQQKGFQDKGCVEDGSWKSCGQNGVPRGGPEGQGLEQLEQLEQLKQDDMGMQECASADKEDTEKELTGVLVVEKEFTDSAVSSQNNLSAVPSRAACAPAELTLFPPLGHGGHHAGPPGPAGPAGPAPDRSSVVQFEPLPDIHVVAAAAAAARRKPAAFGNSLHHGLSVHDWFEEPIENFSRHQLQYLRELGRGWFGRVVEGNAKEIIAGHATSKVIVKILHEDATPTDQSYFLHEAKPYRTLKHPNVLRLVGRCLETHPFLLLLEDCSLGTLKTFLTENRNNPGKLCQQGVLLEMACGVAAGLQHMVENGFVHTDLAARNCLVSSDLTVKVGDYGTSIETFKDEYYCIGDLAIPIRWVAPETLHCTDTTIETKEVTASANVWSLSVVLWEICEFGKLPYHNLSDEEVIEQVLGNRSTCLPFPVHENQPHVHNLYHLMKICWVEAEKRPPLRRVVAMLQHLLQHKNSPAHTSANNNNNSTTSLDDFERRWELSKPNTVPKIDNQVGTSSMQSTPVKAVLLQRCISMEENVAVGAASQLQLHIPADKTCTIPCADSPQLSVSSSQGGEMFVPSSTLAAQKSPSLQNLRGSVDELNLVGTKEGSQDCKSPRPAPVTEEPDFDSWLKGMDTSTEEDVRFVRNISEAIRDLDEVLAQEKTSSSSQNSSAQPSPSQVTSRDMKADSSVSSSQDQLFTLDFRLGQAAASSVISRNFGLLHSIGHESLSLSQNRLESSGSDTEDETWRIRIEKGEFSEKVKEKSKSVADLMVLTHIDYSDGSDSDTTLDLESYVSSLKKDGVGRRSFNRKPLQSSLSVTYGSEGNIHEAVLGEEFQETIRKLHESLRDGSKLEAIPDASLSMISISSSEAADHSPLSQTQSDKGHFLAKLASEKQIKKNDDSDTAVSGASSNKLDSISNNIEMENAHDLICRSSSLDTSIQETPANNISKDAPSDSLSNSSPLSQSTPNHHEDSASSSEGADGKVMKLAPVLTSTPLSSLCKQTPVEETFELDSSLMCSQTISFIDSERNAASISSPLEKRPPSPTPDGVQRKTSDSSCVILGPFEDSTLEYFKGLKTAFPTVKTLDYDVTNEIDLEENSIETWDKFLDHAMQSENGDYPSFSEVSFPKVESESLVSDVNATSDSSDILGSSFEKSGPERMSIATVNSPISNIATNDSITRKSSSPAVQISLDSADVDSNSLDNLRQTYIPTSGNMSTKTNLGLLVPSVNVIEATPISSGRNTPSDVMTGATDPVCLVTKEYPDDNLFMQEKVDTDVKVIKSGLVSTAQDYQDLCSANVELVVPLIKKTELSSQKFDPDLPCCNQSNNYDEFPLFSTSVGTKSDDSYVHDLATECFLNGKLDGDISKDYKPVIPLFSKGFDTKEGDSNGEIMEDEDDFGLGVAKNSTPDDERSSDSGFRDKGSLSESCEDACDEKYNLEDIEAELEEAFSKGVFARHDSPTSNKGLESDCDAVDESFSVTLTDVEKQREQRQAETGRTKDPCHRLDDLLRNDPIQEALSVNVESSADFFGTSPALSPIPQNSGWYLHPPQNHEDEPVSGNDSSYFSFSLDEEFVNAIRNELREKLPCAQMQREESQPQLSDEEELSDHDLDLDESPSKDRKSITIHYKTYPAPLSPILEEGESLCSESSSPLCGYNSSSCSEQMSPVFAVDKSPSNQGDGDIQHMVSECPAEVDGDLSDDCGECGDFDEISERDVLPLDSRSPSNFSKMAAVTKLCLDGHVDENDSDDDVLVVNMETNEATLLESPKPVSKFSFGGNEECDDSSHEDFVPDFLSVAGSYQLPESKFSCVDRLRSDLYLGARPLTLAALPQTSVDIESEDDNDAMTPDSITCEKSFSERTEDSAVGLALSEVMTPDSLIGETQWTGAQMCDSGFGTISTRPSSIVLSSDGGERDSPELNISEFTAVEPEIVTEPEDNLPTTTENLSIKQQAGETTEPSETTQSTEDSESSVSVSSNSVVAVPNSCPNAVGDLKERKASDLLQCVDTSAEVKVEIRRECDDLKKDVASFIVEEAKLSSLQSTLPKQSCLFPQSLKELARNVLGSECTTKEQTLAFNSELLLGDEERLLCKVACVEPVNEFHHIASGGVVEHEKDIDNARKILKPSQLQVEEPLQTLAFSDPDVVERSSFCSAGHIVVSSIIAPLTPNDETLTPGTLAFNDSPESPRDILSPAFKDSDSTEAESHLMSTSFMSADDIYEDRDQYTPDWESGSDGCESETASSSSGEFIWKDGERESSVKAVQATSDSTLSGSLDGQTFNQTPTEFPMSSILEEEEDEEESGSSSCTSDSEDDAEFVPSAWDSQATPSRSALRSPDKKVEQKKNVSFKRQRYHCVYEYPRELSDSDGSDFADSPNRRRTWDLESSSYNLHDWELAANEGLAEVPCQEDSREEPLTNSPSASSQRLFEFFKLSSADYSFGSSMLSEDGEFFISSSAQPFHTLGEAGPSGSSEFFPGRDLTASSVDDVDVVDGVLDNSASGGAARAENQSWRHTEDYSDSDSSDTNMVTASEGKSGDSNSSSTPMLTANGSSKSDSSVYHSIPTNQELQVDSGSDSPLSELSPSSPLSPMSPSHSQGLGELRHTRDRLKLDLPPANTTFVLVAPCKRRSVEQVKGEASLLDGEDLLEGSAFKATASSPCVAVSSDGH